MPPLPPRTPPLPRRMPPLLLLLMPPLLRPMPLPLRPKLRLRRRSSNRSVKRSTLLRAIRLNDGPGST
jgi:hypothetical protein